MKRQLKWTKKKTNMVFGNMKKRKEKIIPRIKENNKMN